MNADDDHGSNIDPEWRSKSSTWALPDRGDSRLKEAAPSTSHFTQHE